MRSKLFLGLASAALVVVIGAAFGTTPDAKQPKVGAGVTATTPSEQPCCCSTKTAAASAGLLYCPLTDTGQRRLLL